MDVARALLIGVALALAADSAPGADPLALGPGTACVLMPEHEAKSMLGVKKRHVLACAGPTGQVVRVIITRKGGVECTDAVQIAADGSTDSVGAPCASVSRSRQGTVPHVVNLSGSWRTDVDSLIGPVNCLSQVVQDGTGISIYATCDIGGEFSGSGTIDFVGLTFVSRGSAQVPIYGYCAAGEMSGTVSPDGQSLSGSLACDGLVVPFTAGRE